MTSIDMETGELVTVPTLDIETSTVFGDVLGAIAKAQAEIGRASKDAVNPHFGKAYATLSSVYEACQESLSKNGVAVVQTPFNMPNGDIGVATLLGVASGQWMKGRLFCRPTKYDAQSLGSVITYLRRYTLSAMVGVAPADDDGNAAVGQPSTYQSSAPRQQQASQANGAEPETVKRERIQGLYNAISKEIAETLDHADLDSLRERRNDDIEAIKAFSPTSYDKLKDRVAKRHKQITGGPDAAEGEPKI